MIDLINLDISKCKEITEELEHSNINNRIGFSCAEKSTILNYLKKRGEELAVLTCSAMDYISNQPLNGTSLKSFTDGKYLWSNEEIYHFEKYDLKLNDDFIQYVLNKTA